MPMDACLTNFARRDWLTDGPLNDVVDPYIEALRNQRYPDHTIRAYLGCLAHFSHWIKTDEIRKCRALMLRSSGASCGTTSLSAHARHLAIPRSPVRAQRYGICSACCPATHTAVTLTDPVAVELERFGEYLSNICGLAPVTRDRRVHYVGTFPRSRVWSSTP
jgi:integrase/recombinase XerD